MKTTKKNAAILKKDAAAETRKVGPSSKSQWDYKKSLLYKSGGPIKKYQSVRSSVKSDTTNMYKEQQDRRNVRKSNVDEIYGDTTTGQKLNISPRPMQLDTLRGRPHIKSKGGSTKHPGFKAVQSSIAKKQGVSKEAAGAILAASTRKASAAAKRANPRLKRVKG